MQELIIKNMVCNRCISAVEQTIFELGFQLNSIKLGHLTLNQELSESELGQLSEALNKIGFEIIDDKKNKIIEHIKTIIIELIHHSQDANVLKLSEHLEKELVTDYQYLSQTFSEKTGTTIEKFYIAQKIERAKELILYNVHTLTEIAEMLNYSSVAYFSNQFKKITGQTPTQFKNNPGHNRIPLDEVQ